MRSLSNVPLLILIAITVDIENVKAAHATLEREKQAQRDRLQLAARAKELIDVYLLANCLITSAKERFGLR